MKLYGLIGKPLTHSFSKSYFTKKFAADHLNDHTYENFELEDIEQLCKLINDHKNLQGLNVTIPYKEQVIPFLHQQNDIVQEIGACNCIKVIDGKLYGFNTDVLGFKQSLAPKLKAHHTYALILGTGGAAKAVAYALKLLGVEYLYVSRKNNESLLTYNTLNKAVINKHKIIINTTPLGMYPAIDTFPEIPYQYLSDNHLLYDLTYNPEQTAFLKKGAERGAEVYNGYEMLVIQAEESWKIWNH